MKTSKGMDDEKRLFIIQKYLSGSSKYSLVKEFNLGSSQRISKWMCKFGIENPNETIPMKRTPNEESQELAKLRSELKQAKLDLQYQKMRADAYDTMIDVAEETFHIPVRKKAGAKQ